MGILDEDVARVRDATDVVAVVSEHVALKRVGRRFVGLCPFHAEKTASFNVNPELGRYYCFGCGARGDAIEFVREIEHVDFVGAVERLAGLSGITLRYDDVAYSKERQRRERLTQAVGAAVDFYHQILLEAPEGRTARGYLRSRGFDGDAARRFKLGWAPDGFDRLVSHLRNAGYSRTDLVDAGLAFVNRSDRAQDQFRARLMFPVFDARGEPVGFGGRSLDDNGPKYKNSPESSLYHKSRILYGLHWAKAEIAAHGEAVVCEGYTDVLAYHLAGVPTAVATCGTALADGHVEVLKNLARRVVLAYDGDRAGQEAAARWYEWEKRYEIELRVARLPDGRDPGDLWPDGADALRDSVSGAEPFLRFRLDRVLAGADVSSPEGRARAAEAAARLVAEHPSDLVRDQYVMLLAGRLDIDADRLRDAVVRAASAPSAPAPSSMTTRRPNVASGSDARDREYDDDGRDDARDAYVAEVHLDRREADVLRWAIHRPELVSDWLDESLFSDQVSRAAFTALAGAETFHDALDAADGASRVVLERLAVEEPPADPELETLEVRLMGMMGEAAAARLVASYERVGDDRFGEGKRLLDDYAHQRAEGWSTAGSTARQLVAWASQQVGTSP